MILISCRFIGNIPPKAVGTLCGVLESSKNTHDFSSDAYLHSINNLSLTSSFSKIARLSIID